MLFLHNYKETKSAFLCSMFAKKLILFDFFDFVFY